MSTSRVTPSLAITLVSIGTLAACSTIEEGGTGTSATSGPFIPLPGGSDDTGDTFEAASNDLDGEGLTHTWWVPPWFLGTGTLLEATLPPGSYRVYLTSTDPSGRSDSTALHHVRSCQ